MNLAKQSFQYVSRKLRPREDYRFLTGKGRFAGDLVLPKMVHVALVGSTHAHARLLSVDVSRALAHPGVVAAVTGEDLRRDTNPIPNYLETPTIREYPLAVDKVRYVGEWVAAIIATDRYVAEDAAELVDVEYDPLPAVIDAEKAIKPDSPLVHEGEGSNVAWHRRFVWGPVEEDFAGADVVIRQRFRWRRHSGVPIETFAVSAEWDEGTSLLNVWASIQMPQFEEQLAHALRLPVNSIRVFHDVDVGGSYGTKRGIKHSILVGYLARLSARPVQLVEDRLEYMRGGGAHGPDRVFYAELAASREGLIKSFRLKTIDDNGAFPGRSPMQMGKPLGAIVGPYRINSVEYEGVAVTTNKTPQIAFRGFGQSPTNFVLERMVDRLSKEVKVERIELRRRNYIHPEEFPYAIPSGTTYDSGDYPEVLRKALESADFPALLRFQAEARERGRLIGIGVSGCVEPGGGNAMFLSLLNPKNEVTTFPEGVLVKIDATGTVSAQISFSSAGQSHETMIAMIVGEQLGVHPDKIRVLHADSLSGLPTQTPVASRMAIVAGTAAYHAAGKLKAKMVRIAAHNLRIPEDDLEYRQGKVICRSNPKVEMGWDQLVRIAHKQFHRLPISEEPGLQAIHVQQVPSGGKLPTDDGRVHMYPCYSFSVHIPVVEVDPETGLVKILRYYVAHDCGTVINPDVVDGMVIGGIGHGIGAALYEEFVYDEETGQFLSQSLMDYLLPSALEIPPVELTAHCTPSPLTPLGQKGVGEGGYMTAPAAVASAVEDALSGLGVTITELPMTPDRVFRLLESAQTHKGV